MKAPLPGNEEERLAALYSYNILDTLPEQAFDDLTRLAAYICGTPISLISLIDRERQWFKSRVGPATDEVPRDIAFCAHGILESDLFVVPDAQVDDRFKDNPLVTADPHIRFYAGIPLISEESKALGMLCVIDRVPRRLSPGQQEALRVLGRQVVAQLELRRNLADQTRVNADLARAAEELRESQRSRKAVERMKDELVATVSHELRTPLASLRGFTELMLARRFTPEKQREYLSIMHNESIRLTALINDFLDIQRIESGHQTYRFETVDTAVFLRDTVDLFSPEDNRHPVRLQLPDHLPAVQADPDRLRQVFCNLLANAAKFSPQGGDISVGARQEGEALVFWVEDQGLGIPPEAQSSLFSKFFRVSSEETRRIGGTGLGLALVKQLVEAHQGRVWLESEPGKGSTFYFTLPMAQ